jgi:hypothetical protein
VLPNPSLSRTSSRPSNLSKLLSSTDRQTIKLISLKPKTFDLSPLLMSEQSRNSSSEEFYQGRSPTLSYYGGLRAANNRPLSNPAHGFSTLAWPWLRAHPADYDDPMVIRNRFSDRDRFSERYVGSHDVAIGLTTSSNRVIDFVVGLPRIALSDIPADDSFCSICYETYPGPDSGARAEFPSIERPVQLPCSYIIGDRCILRWFSGDNSTCPHCRRRVIPQSVGVHGHLEAPRGPIEAELAEALDTPMVTSEPEVAWDRNQVAFYSEEENAVLADIDGVDEQRSLTGDSDRTIQYELG